MMRNRLKNIMDREEVTAAQICRELGLDRGYLSRFLNGKVNISLPRLIEIADYLGYDLQLVKRKHPRKESE
jgi:transcriptional regulator with XRE-family HTH domain